MPLSTQISGTEVVVRFTDAERNLLIEIEDNGPGIDENILVVFLNVFIE